MKLARLAFGFLMVLARAIDRAAEWLCGFRNP